MVVFQLNFVKQFDAEKSGLLSFVRCHSCLRNQQSTHDLKRAPQRRSLTKVSAACEKRHLAAASGITCKATQPLQVTGKSNVQGFHHFTTVQSTSSHRY